MELAYGFFFRRKPVDFGVQNTGPTRRLLNYQATSQALGTVISSGLATLHELDTVYGVEDLWILLEVHAVDRHNAYLMSQNNGNSHR